MKSYEEFRAEVLQRKRERWAEILNAEPPGRLPGRRKRDAEQERLLTEADRRAVARSPLLATRRRVPVEPE